MAKSLDKSFSNIKFLAMDVDGVLTDGKLYFGRNPDPMVAFHVQDGFGLQLARAAGIRLAWITGRKNISILARSRELEIDDVVMGVSDKLATLQELLTRNNLFFSHTAFIGDDLVDIPVVSAVGLGVAVADAVPDVKEAADYITTRGGGAGAVREVVDMILKRSGRWDAALKKVLRG